MKRPKRWLRNAALLLVVLATLYLARGLWLPALARGLDIGQPPHRSDCVLVLGGDATTRPFVAAALIKAGLAERALVVASPPSPLGEHAVFPPQHELVRGVLRLRGVPEANIVLLPTPVTNTQDEARALAAYLDGQPGATVAVVTNWFHTRRARSIFSRELRQHSAQLSFVSAPHDRCQPDSWWYTPEGCRMVLHEYVSLGYYTARDQPAAAVLVLAAAALLMGLAWAARRRRLGSRAIDGKSEAAR